MSHLKKLNEDCGVVLPYELERNIFELAAYAFPGHAVKLCTLSKYVQEWMEAIIYGTVVLELPILTVDLFMRTFQSRPPSFFAKNVKRLYITGVLTFEQAQVILEACTNAVELTCWVYPHMYKDNLLYQLHPQNLRRLSITLEALWGASCSGKFTPALFPHLSHLEIVNPPGTYLPLSIDWNSLAALPSLTHFALGTLNFRNHARFITPLGQLLDQRRELQVLVIVTSDRSMTDELRKSGVDSDERVLVQTEFTGSMTVHDYWQGLRKGGPDFWAMADKSLDSRGRSRTKLDTQSMNNPDIPLPPFTAGPVTVAISLSS